MSRRRVLFWLLGTGVALSLTFAADGWYRRTRPDHRLRRGLEAVQRDDFTAAVELAERLEAAGAADHAHLLYAAMHLRRGRPNDAVARFNQIEADEPRVEGALLFGEWLVRHQAQPAEAERLLRFALQHRPDHIAAHRGLAAVYYDQGAWALAINHLLRWAELDGRDGRPFRFIGLIYKDMDHTNPAIAGFREALKRELSPAVTREVREELAECLTSQSQYAEALDVLRQCGPENDRTPRLQALRGECLAGLGRTSEAAAVLDAALRRAPEMVELLRARGKLHADARQYAEAAAIFERALALDPHELTCRYQLSLACDRLGRQADATRHRQALEASKKEMLALTKLIQDAGERPWDDALHRRLAAKCEAMSRPDLARRWHKAADARATPAATPR